MGLKSAGILSFPMYNLKKWGKRCETSARSLFTRSWLSYFPWTAPSDFPTHRSSWVPPNKTLLYHQRHQSHNWDRAWFSQPCASLNTIITHMYDNLVFIGQFIFMLFAVVIPPGEIIQLVLLFRLSLRCLRECQAAVWAVLPGCTWAGAEADEWWGTHALTTFLIQRVYDCACVCA